MARIVSSTESFRVDSFHTIYLNWFGLNRTLGHIAIFRGMLVRHEFHLVEVRPAQDLMITVLGGKRLNVCGHGLVDGHIIGGAERRGDDRTKTQEKQSQADTVHYLPCWKFWLCMSMSWRSRRSCPEGLFAPLDFSGRFVRRGVEWKGLCVEPLSPAILSGSIVDLGLVDHFSLSSGGDCRL